MTTYKIGTRGSLLAVTQSTIIKNQLEAFSGEKFELVTIKTQGDQVTDRPLWQLEGKDFFTKELDEALLKGEVDLVIHSYKDLGSERPAGIKLAAVTERKFAHDVLLIPNQVIHGLKDWKGELIVGTSSPRRIVNLQHALKDYLPHANERGVTVTCKMLRGNINSRIRKLKEGQYHAITLALAGIERLAHTEKSATELSELLEGLNYFVLPQSIFPSAAAQGALGIEMREDRDDGDKLAHLLNKLSHEKTVEEVIRERKTFKEFGGGCHLAVGIHVRKLEDTFLHVTAGEVDGVRIENKWLEGVVFPPIEKGKKLFVGLSKGNAVDVIYDEYLAKIPEAKKLDLTGKHLFITSKYCVETLKNSNLPEGLWAAGVKSARELVKKGFWVNGSADSLGTDDLKCLRTSRALQMIHPHLGEKWNVLSHHLATSDMGQVIGCYERVEKKLPDGFEEKLHQVGACYWTSYPQYLSYMLRFPFLHQAKHFCGLGKTWQEFKEANIKVHPMASMEDFYGLRK